MTGKGGYYFLKRKNEKLENYNNFLKDVIIEQAGTLNDLADFQDRDDRRMSLDIMAAILIFASMIGYLVILTNLVPIIMGWVI